MPVAGGSPGGKAQGAAILVRFQPSPFLGGPAAAFGQSIADPGAPGNRIQKSKAKTKFTELIHG